MSRGLTRFNEMIGCSGNWQQGASKALLRLAYTGYRRRTPRPHHRAAIVSNGIVSCYYGDNTPGAAKQTSGYRIHNRITEPVDWGLHTLAACIHTAACRISVSWFGCETAGDFLIENELRKVKIFVHKFFVFFRGRRCRRCCSSCTGQSARPTPVKIQAEFLVSPVEFFLAPERATVTSACGRAHTDEFGTENRLAHSHQRVRKGVCQFTVSLNQ